MIFSRVHVTYSFAQVWHYFQIDHNDGSFCERSERATEITTRIAPALLGLRQALKISIYDYLSKFHQINAELFLNYCYDAIIFIAVSQYEFDLVRARSFVPSLYLNVNGEAQSQYLSKDLRNRK